MKVWSFHLNLITLTPPNYSNISMEKTSLVKKLFAPKNRDYTYTIFFLLIFSFFIFYVIRPNLISVFEANTKIKQLKQINKTYEDQIDKIIDVQSILEENREDFGYLNEAISAKPEVNKVLSDVDVSSSASKLVSQRIDISDINLKDRGAFRKLKSFDVNLSLRGDFEDGLSFLRKIYEQRRLKLAQEATFSRPEKEASQSSSLEIKFQVEGYYL